MIQIIVTKAESSEVITHQDHVDTLLLVKVGDAERPASYKDISSVAEAIAQAVKRPEGDRDSNLTIGVAVTHHAVTIERHDLNYH
jgi:hypothetical protein